MNAVQDKTAILLGPSISRKHRGQEFGCPCSESWFTLDAAPVDDGQGDYPDRLLAALRFDAQVSDTPDPLAPGCMECRR